MTRTIAVLPLLLWVAASVDTSADAMSRPGLDSVASALAGSPARVSCVAMNRNNAGEADAVSGRIWLNARLVCSTLLAAPRIITPAWPRANSGEAVLALAHEAIHLRGVRDEERTECLGLRALPRAARLLGFAKGQVPVLRKQAVATTYCGAAA